MKIIYEKLYLIIFSYTNIINIINIYNNNVNIIINYIFNI